MNHRPADLPPGSTVDLSTPPSHDVPPMPSPVVPLPEWHHACGSCGIAVEDSPDGPPLDTVEAWETEGRPVFVRTEPRPVMRTSVTTCPSCVDRAVLAGQLVAGHPALVGKFGPAGAEHRVSLVLDALDLVGVPLERVAPSPDDGTLGRLIHLLAVEAGSARWRQRLGPVAAADADPRTCASTPWGHVPDEARTRIRQAVARVLAERSAKNAPPVELQPPTPTTTSGTVVGGGCLICGTAAVVLPAAAVQRLGGRERAAAEVWRPFAANSRALGGDHAADRLVGHLCPLCTTALADVGNVVGTRAMERSLRQHLTDAGRAQEASNVILGEMRGIVAWGALVARQRAQGRPENAPGAEPWQHQRVAAG